MLNQARRCTEPASKAGKHARAPALKDMRKKGSKKVGCRASIFMRVHAADPATVQVSLDDSHIGHGVGDNCSMEDLHHMRLNARMIMYVARDSAT